MHLDVATGGELHVALAAGVPGRAARRCTATTRATTSCAAPREPACGRIVVDSLRRARPARCARTARTALVPTVLLRVTPGVEAHTHEFVRTGQDDSKFGFGLASGDAAARGRAGRGVATRSSWSGCTCTSAARCSSPTSSHQAVEVDRAVRAATLGLRRALDRRRARRRLRRRRGGADRSPSGATSVRAGVRRRPASPRAVTAEPGRADRRRRPASRSTRSAR